MNETWNAFPWLGLIKGYHRSCLAFLFLWLFLSNRATHIQQVFPVEQRGMPTRLLCSWLHKKPWKSRKWRQLVKNSMELIIYAGFGDVKLKKKTSTYNLGPYYKGLSCIAPSYLQNSHDSSLNSSFIGPVCFLFFFYRKINIWLA